MLIVAGTMEVDPDRMEEALSALGPLVAATRAEPGCRDYAFSVEPGPEGTLRLFEIWDDEAALAAHFETPHMAEFRKVRADVGIGSGDVTKYQVSGSGPVR